MTPHNIIDIQSLDLIFFPNSVVLFVDDCCVFYFL